MLGAAAVGAGAGGLDAAAAVVEAGLAAAATVGALLLPVSVPPVVTTTGAISTNRGSRDDRDPSPKSSVSSLPPLQTPKLRMSVAGPAAGATPMDASSTLPSTPSRSSGLKPRLSSPAARSDTSFQESSPRTTAM